MQYIESEDVIRYHCHKILSDDSLLNKNCVTFCNIAVFDMLEYFNLQWNFWNLSEKRIMLANEMCDVLKNKYIKVSYEDAIREKCNLYIAALKNPIGHGHVAIIYPSDTVVFSKKWDCKVPLVCNVGKTNGVMGLNWAFSDKPDIYFISKINKRAKDERYNDI